MGDTTVLGATSKKSFPTGHAFPGEAGEAADLMAEVARRLALLPPPTAVVDEEVALLHKRFHAALALARHDAHAAGAALTALLERLPARSRALVGTAGNGPLSLRHNASTVQL